MGLLPTISSKKKKEMKMTTHLYRHQTITILEPLQSLYNGLDCGAYGKHVQHCSNHLLINQAKQLHARLVLFSITLDNYLASKLINFYSKSNHIHEARHLFDAIPNKNTFSWNAMLIGYSSNNLHSNALNLFSALLSSVARPDSFTIRCVLKASSSLFFDRMLAKEIHCYAVRHCFDSDVCVVNALITYYFKCGQIRLARIVFERMFKKDLVSWNAIISGYSQSGCYEECKALYGQMLNVEGVRPNGVTMISVLQACANTKDLLFGMDVHRFVIENKIEMDIVLCNALVGFFAKCGSLDYARELFEQMNEKDEITYGSIISGYMAHGYIDKAMDIFHQINIKGLNMWNAVISGMGQNNHHERVPELVREMQASGFKPNLVTLSSLLPTISFFSNLRAGKEIHCYAIKNYYDRNIYLATAMIDTYCKSGFLLGAKQVFDQSKERSVIIWTAIISSYAAHGDVNTALGLFTEMLKHGTRPDHIAFTAVLAACGHTGLVDEAWKLFDAMLPKFSIQPSVEHYACMVGVLSRAKRLDEAVEFISKMPMNPNAKVWGALLNGASVTGNVEVGKYAFDHLIKIEPECTGNYVIMANIYSQAGRWEEAEKVRRRMKNSGLIKFPGSSWIETSEGLQNFTAKDTLNKRTKEIYVLLDGLLEMMREEGYILQDEFDEESFYG